MFDLIRKIWQTKTVTKTALFQEAPSRFRGKPVFSSNQCSGCESCVTSCPAGAIRFSKQDDSITLSISYTSCIFCGICAENCKTNTIIATNEYMLATKNKADLKTEFTTSLLKTPDLITAGKEGD